MTAAPSLGQDLDPSAANVVPWVLFDAATIEVSVPQGMTMPGVEGGVLFLRLTDTGGRVILDRPFRWPNDRQPIPTGRFHLAPYWRGCNGNWGNLSAPAAPLCEYDIDVAPHQAVVNVSMGNFQGDNHCEVATS